MLMLSFAVSREASKMITILSQRSIESQNRLKLPRDSVHVGPAKPFPA